MQSISKRNETISSKDTETSEQFLISHESNRINVDSDLEAVGDSIKIKKYALAVDLLKKKAESEDDNYQQDFVNALHEVSSHEKTLPIQEMSIIVNMYLSLIEQQKSVYLATKFMNQSDYLSSSKKRLYIFMDMVAKIVSRKPESISKKQVDEINTKQEENLNEHFEKNPIESYSNRNVKSEYTSRQELVKEMIDGSNPIAQRLAEMRIQYFVTSKIRQIQQNISHFKNPKLISQIENVYYNKLKSFLRSNVFIEDDIVDYMLVYIDTSKSSHFAKTLEDIIVSRKNQKDKRQTLQALMLFLADFDRE